MSIFDKIHSSKPKAPRITIYGKMGMGKTTLSTKFPNPLVLLTEEPYVFIKNRTTIYKSFKEIKNDIHELVNTKDIPYETIVLDSISKLDNLIEKYILESYPQSDVTLASVHGGYGAGHMKMAEYHRAIKDDLDLLQDRGITVIYVGHTDINTIKSPDKNDYDQYMVTASGKLVRKVYTDDVDAVFFCKEKSSFVDASIPKNKKEESRKIIKSLGERILVCGLNEAYQTKNRFTGMPNEIPMDFEEIKKYIAFYKGEKNNG